MHRQGLSSVGPDQPRHISLLCSWLPFAHSLVGSLWGKEFTRSHVNGPEATEGGKHFYLIPPPMGSFPCEVCGKDCWEWASSSKWGSGRVKSQNSLPKVPEEVRTKAGGWVSTMGHSGGLNLKGLREGSVSSPSSYMLIVEICLQLLRSFSKSLVQSLAHSIPPVYVLNELGRFYGLYSVWFNFHKSPSVRYHWTFNKDESFVTFSKTK